MDPALTHEAFQQLHIQLPEDFTDQRAHLGHQYRQKGQVRGQERSTGKYKVGDINATEISAGSMARGAPP
jgi:hypothetical protein